MDSSLGFLLRASSGLFFLNGVVEAVAPYVALAIVQWVAQLVVFAVLVSPLMSVNCIIFRYII